GEGGGGGGWGRRPWGFCARRSGAPAPKRASQRVPPVRRDLGVGVERKALHTGTAGPRERGRLALAATARADAPDLLASSLATGDALLHRGGHGTGELGCVIDQRIISRGHGGDDARFQSTSTIPGRPAPPLDTPSPPPRPKHHSDRRGTARSANPARAPERLRGASDPVQHSEN